MPELDVVLSIMTRIVKYCFLLWLFSILACKEEPNSFNPRLKNMNKRITGEWLLTKLVENDSINVNKTQNEFLTLNGDGTGLFRIEGLDSFFYSTAISWNFASRTSFHKNKESVFIYSEVGAMKLGTLYRIRELTDILMVLECKADSFNKSYPKRDEVRTYCKLK